MPEDRTTRPTQVSTGNSGRGPGFVTYTRDTFTKLNWQHNIMVLVGNGFDIQVLHDYEQPVDSRYEPFYHHLKMRGFDPSNQLLKHMDEELRNGRKNWSDIEAAVAAAVNTGRPRSCTHLRRLASYASGVRWFPSRCGPQRPPEPARRRRRYE
ncbi:hypothetical protein GCM10022262_42150 [Georgenia daeguensis]|uniref:NYN domain-containing protein n=1 Tax=Georgenia daeguensis TaxID=908355 RepID=A0ABP6UQJ6_9MICO